MYLKKQKIIENRKRDFAVNVEKIDDTLVLVNITDIVETTNPICYWRIFSPDLADIPPIEIGVDYDCCIIKSFTIFIDLDYVCSKQVNIKESILGDVLLDTSLFTKRYDFIDVRQGYQIYVMDDKLICLFSDESDCIESVDSGAMEIYFNSAKELVGIAVCGISLENVRYRSGLFRKGL